MVRIRRSPTQEISGLHRRMESVLHALLRDLPAIREPQLAWVPRTDIRETAAGFIVTLEIPGIDREAIDIVVEGPYLAISGQRPEPVAGTCTRWHQMEILHGAFERVLALPDGADADGISALYRDGFLEITIPRAGGGARSVPIEGS